jgi:hypothetical protein
MIRIRRHRGRWIRAVCLLDTCGVAPARLVGAVIVPDAEKIQRQWRSQVANDVF